MLLKMFDLSIQRHFSPEQSIVGQTAVMRETGSR